jgi:hypothetical protein
MTTPGSGNLVPVGPKNKASETTVACPIALVSNDSVYTDNSSGSSVSQTPAGTEIPFPLSSTTLPPSGGTCKDPVESEKPEQGTDVEQDLQDFRMDVDGLHHFERVALQKPQQMFSTTGTPFSSCSTRESMLRQSSSEAQVARSETARTLQQFCLERWTCVPCTPHISSRQVLVVTR